MISEKGLKAINNIIKSVSETKNSSEFRQTFLSNLRDCVDFDLGVFDVCKTSNTKLLLYDPIVLSDFGEDFEKDFIYQYDTKYVNLSYSKWLHNEERNIILRDTDILNEKTRQKSRYYNEYICKFGFEYGVNCEYSHNKINVASMTLYRCKGKENFSDSDIDSLDLLIPCVLRGIESSLDIYIPDQKIDSLEKFNLTEREKMIVSLIYEGKTNNEIAEIIYISENTVKKHVSNIYQKIGINSRAKFLNFLNSLNYMDY